MTRLICILLTLLLSLSGPATGTNSDFGLCCLAAKVTPEIIAGTKAFRVVSFIGPKKMPV